jgi:hypothetical protein
LIDTGSFVEKRATNLQVFGRTRLMTLGKSAFKGGEPSEAFFILIESPYQNQESVVRGGDFIG